jgi:hypothetical protein
VPIVTRVRMTRVTQHPWVHGRETMLVHYPIFFRNIWSGHLMRFENVWLSFCHLDVWFFTYNREISGLSLQHVRMPMGLAIDETSPCRDLCSILKCHSHAKKLDCGGIRIPTFHPNDKASQPLQVTWSFRLGPI